MKKSQQKTRGSQVFICIFPRPQLNFLFSPTLSSFHPPPLLTSLYPQDHESLFLFMAAFSMSYFSWMCSLIPIVFSVGWRVSKQSRPQQTLEVSPRVSISFPLPNPILLPSPSLLPTSSPHPILSLVYIPTPTWLHSHESSMACSLWNLILTPDSQLDVNWSGKF